MPTVMIVPIKPIFINGTRNETADRQLGKLLDASELIITTSCLIKTEPYKIMIENF